MRGHYMEEGVVRRGKKSQHPVSFPPAWGRYGDRDIGADVGDNGDGK